MPYFMKQLYNKTIISCWNLFQSALALHALNDVKQSEFFIHYIRTQLNEIYKGRDKNVYINSVPIPIMEDGTLKGIINFNDNIKIYTIDAEYERTVHEHVEYAPEVVKAFTDKKDGRFVYAVSIDKSYQKLKNTKELAEEIIEEILKEEE